MASRIVRSRETVTFRPERFHATPIAQNERVKVLLVSFEPGQFIPVHRPGVDLTLVVLEGEGRVAAGENEEPVGPGTVIFVPAGDARGVKADTRLVAISVVRRRRGQAITTRSRPACARGTWRP